MTRQPDVVVIGSGAGGGAAAWSLVENGLSVLLLEAGPRFDPSQDYPMTNPDWERHLFPSKPGSRAEVLYGDLGRLDPADAQLQSFDAVTPLQPPGPYRRAGATGYSHVRGVGGSTLHYVGEAHRLHPTSFRLASDHGAGLDWPLSYDDLAPHYTMAEDILGVAGPELQHGRPRQGPFSQPAHPLSPAARRLAEAGGRIGLPFEANSRAVLSQPFDDRPACNYCGQCSRGCPIGDKGSTDVTFLRRAARTGRLTLLPGAEVTRLELGSGGRVAAVHFVRDGRAHRQETPILVLAAGAVQTPRLLLASAAPETPDGVANGSGQVGRNFLETLSWFGASLLPGLTDSHKGLPADAVCWAENAPDGVPDALGGCRYTSAVQEAGLTGPISYATRLIPGHGAEFQAALHAAFGSAIAVGATGAVIADDRSHVSLHPERRDAFDVPLPVISSVLTARSLALLHHMSERGRALLAETGAGELREQRTSWDIFTSTHVFGTARMGHDSATSVTDSQGRSHDHDNLWIADASLFPGSGGGEGPSLTIHALALRAADDILATR